MCSFACCLFVFIISIVGIVYVYCFFFLLYCDIYRSKAIQDNAYTKEKKTLPRCVIESQAWVRSFIFTHVIEGLATPLHIPTFREWWKGKEIARLQIISRRPWIVLAAFLAAIFPLFFWRCKRREGKGKGKRKGERGKEYKMWERRWCFLMKFSFFCCLFIYV